MLIEVTISKSHCLLKATKKLLQLVAKNQRGIKMGCKVYYYKVISLVLFISFLGLASCNDDNSSCLLPEELALSDCLAEDLINICKPFFCEVNIETEERIINEIFLFPPNNECQPLDCNTLDCAIDSYKDSQANEVGIYKNLQIDKNGLPSGIVNINNQQVNFICHLTAPE